jgi:hypothetical protein
MIYIVEFPEQSKAHAWFAFDRQDFLRKIYVSDVRKEWEIFDVVTARELLELVGKTADAADAREEFPAICSLGKQHGWDTPLYRADYLLGEGVFDVEAVSEIDACVAALAQRSPRHKIFWSDSQATAAMEHDPIFDNEAGSWGREALNAQLVALEILEGNQ